MDKYLEFMLRLFNQRKDRAEQRGVQRIDMGQEFPGIFDEGDTVIPQAAQETDVDIPEEQERIIRENVAREALRDERDAAIRQANELDYESHMLRQRQLDQENVLQEAEQLPAEEDGGAYVEPPLPWGQEYAQTGYGPDRPADIPPLQPVPVPVGPPQQPLARIGRQLPPRRIPRRIPRPQQQQIAAFPVGRLTRLPSSGRRLA